MSHHVVWAGVASRTHVIYGASWIRELLRREPGEVVVELMGSRTFFGQRAITADDVAAILPDEVEVRAWEGGRAPKESRLWMLSVGAVGIKPWLRLRAKHPFRALPVIVTDEGLGTYGDWKARRQASARQGTREPWLSVRTTAVQAATRLIASSRWALHVETEDGWALNRAAAAEFRRLAPEPEQGNSAVFLSQPWPELGVLGEDEYGAHIDEVARACRAAGLDFVVLPHPGEDPERYADRRVSPSSALAEFNPAALGAKLLLGASSTAMLNLAAVFGIPAMRVGTPELGALDRELAPRQASLLAHYAAPTITPGELGRRLAQGFGR